MRLTAFADYGLRSLLVLAAGGEANCSSAALAERLGVSREHLVKVLQRLAAGGYVRTVRGPGGGVRLARPAASIRLGEVLAWLEQEPPLAECFRADGGDCALTEFCGLRPRLDRARRAFYATLDESTLADCISSGLQRFVRLEPAHSISRT
ncbi:MAG: Rrf2 family transcriptional regulator [Betaproteobacteria bacterium]|nr:Rrf2 family transcriptional regulator [Betaproteobacteria bacterium]MBU6513075.1 Rrf2 family transcriptional regulator [Betaproteobacteria bacterium]MDE1955455.1 Rrf2 family transcriptional regulator [Betaproteobacteria bacterium]MDE2151808.1 Rrf2 family transcriptional regulator [Betaproteobacteria bacterium]MDE2477481.1 Rrf2 family transcriptional regulator [Betaproteobacteria bacterium]